MAGKEKKIASRLKAVKYVWGLLCSMSIIDQQRNNISLINVIDQVNVPKAAFENDEPKAVGLAHEIVIVLRRSIGAELCTDRILVETKISLVDPNGKKLTESSVPVAFEIGKRIMRYRMQLPAITVTTTGDYGISVEIMQPESTEMEECGWIPFTVTAV